MTKILLVNDDGVAAPGLRHLWEALKDVAEVTIVAPAHEMSGKGVSISMHEPLYLRSYDWPGANAYSVNGTPADCVRIALHACYGDAPDFVFSGVNRGSNAGRTVLYSGTVGGAIEASYNGIPAVALSSIDHEEPNYAVAAEQAPVLLKYLQEHPLEQGTILNVNVPSEECKGIRMARQGMRFWKAQTHERTHPAGHTYFWSWGVPSDCDESEECDTQLLRQGYGTAVPIQVSSLTCQNTYDAHTERFNDFFSSYRAHFSRAGS
jgi:5'/3'-nucleotidase